MKKITKEELRELLRKHHLWLMNEPGGERANLTGADLTGADLTRADLTRADLNGANLTRADLTGANLTRANLAGADLTRADLTGANLTVADLTRADLNGADLNGANNIFFPIACPEKGSFVGYKKASGLIVELLITPDAKRCSATTRKCRCSKAFVVSITKTDGSEAGVMEVASNFDKTFIYKVGEMVEVTNFNDNRWDECSAGIHFFITREEAVRW